jgi:hypothetical protein
MSDFTTQFLKDIERHTLTVVRDDGLHRQLWFGRPGTSCMHFQIITWPGYLCYTGDMGTYVFKRLEDMLQFFRHEKRPNRKPYQIDFRYWDEKVEAADKCDGIQEFSPAKFDRAVKDYVLEWVRDHREETTREERRDLWEDVHQSIVDLDDDRHGSRKLAAAYDFSYFSHEVNTRRRFRLDDFVSERSFSEYTQRFLWCCHALAWGIEQYDNAKQATQERAAA